MYVPSSVTEGNQRRPVSRLLAHRALVVRLDIDCHLNELRKLVGDLKDGPTWRLVYRDRVKVVREPLVSISIASD